MAPAKGRDPGGAWRVRRQQPWPRCDDWHKAKPRAKLRSRLIIAGIESAWRLPGEAGLAGQGDNLLRHCGLNTEAAGHDLAALPLRHVAERCARDFQSDEMYGENSCPWEPRAFLAFLAELARPAACAHTPQTSM